MYWLLICLLLLFALRFTLTSSVEDISAHVHVAANDHLVVFTRNRDAEFHITLSPYETPTVVLHLNYTLVQTEAVRSLVIPDRLLRHGLMELVFIGEHINSSAQTLFHAKLQTDVRNQTVSVVHLVQKSIASLSSVGVECALGIHPRGTHAFVVGDRAGYIYDMNESQAYNWSPWQEFRNKRYPKAISVTADDCIIVGAYLQMVDTHVPNLYKAKFDPKNETGPLESFADGRYVEITNIRARASITLRGSFYGDDFIMAVGLPSIDTVLLYVSTKDFPLNGTVHRSVETGVNFGQVITLAANNTYGVLSSELATPPWSTGRVQVRYLLRTYF